MERFINLQENIYERISKAKTNFKKSPKERVTRPYIEIRLSSLEELWQQFKKNHDSLILETELEELKASVYSNKNVFDSCEDCYLEYKLLLITSLESFKNGDKSYNSEPSIASSSQVKLPKIVIPMFSGSYTEWVTFRDLFTSLVHNSANLDNVQKMHYLKGYLAGEAEQLVRHISISEQNYEKAWTMLTDRYNNKKYLTKNILQRLFGQKSATQESAQHLKDLVDTTCDCLNGLSNLGVNVSDWDTIVIYILSMKLDPETKRQWEFTSNSGGSSEILSTFSEFKEFLISRSRALEALEPKLNVSNLKPSSKPKVLHVVDLKCLFCSNAHALNVCKMFSNETVDARRNFVRDKQLCFNCLGSSHTARFCKKFVKCHLCKKRHHTLLHQESSALPTTTPRNQEENCSMSEGTSNEASKNQLLSCFSAGRTYNQVLLATALIQARSKNGSYYPLRALLDQGSQASFVTESVVQLLGLKKIPIKGNVLGVGGNCNIISKAMVIFEIRSKIEPEVVIRVRAYVLRLITSLLPARQFPPIECVDFQGIQLADPGYNIPSKIDLLLGGDIYSQVLKEGVKRDPYGAIVAQSTSLGWILSGGVNGSSSSGTMTCHSRIEDDDLIKRFWELELEPALTKPLLTEEEKLCENLYATTTYRDEDGRFVVRLPLRSEDPTCKYGNSREIAVRRLLTLEKKFERNEEFKQRYKQVIEEYLQLNHMELVSESDMKVKNAVYLPHHAVVREDKDTTKFRVVFDASCKGSNGVSLNDDLMIGPTLQADLRHIILRWRVPPICMAADIIKMYRQVKVNVADVDYQRILWRDDPSSEIKDYRLLRVTFGTACAPYLAVRSLQQVAQEYIHNKKYQLVSERILNDFYMDDFMTGCDSIEDGIKIYKLIGELLGKSGFEVQKWTSNSDQLLQEINKGKETKTEDEVNGMEIKMDKIIKILGLTWNRSMDVFHYTVTLPNLQKPLTKRKVVSDICRLFDPLGWVAPSVILAKVMIQKIWLAGIDWDQEVPEELAKEWQNYRNELPYLSDFKIPRWLGTKSIVDQLELHGFCDASQAAYAAVIYIRMIDCAGNVRVSLVTAKTKVAPIKQVSIPRLELCGAVLLSKLLSETGTVLKINKINWYAWTDSTVVLAWLSSHPGRWKTFIANRVSEILTSIDSGQWFHVRSPQNPADVASRGLSPQELSKNKLWLCGPEFLHKKNIKYEKPNNLNTELEVVKVHTSALIDGSLWERYSSLTKLIRIVAYVRRFLGLRRSCKRHQTSYLTSEELRLALENIIKICQNEHFGDDMERLKKDKGVSKKSKLYALNPFLDDQNILRVGGRLGQSQLSSAQKHPIIIPKDSPITKLLINNVHIKTMHGGPQLMMTYISSAYWIFGLKQLIKTCVHKCVTCVKNTIAARTQIMGQLPASRVTPNRPFKNSGVDYAGPIQLRVSKGRGQRSYKGYICLFVCMSTKAIHLEVVSELTSKGFLQAFKRFVARRGHCQDLWSDNGTNFVGASRELSHLFNFERSCMLTEVAESLANNGTTWHFIPPHAPNFGGLWEAGVKSVKFHLKRVVGDSTLTYEEMATVLAQIEACLNSRPLSRLNDVADDRNILTPGHFLVSEALVSVPDQNFEGCNIGSLRRWQYTQRMLQDFWRKWSGEYLRRFFQTYKWKLGIPEPDIGDVVIVRENDLPPCRWLYGRIVSKHPGPDGITRVVSLQTKNSVIKRPLSKVCVLPLVTE